MFEGNPKAFSKNRQTFTVSPAIIHRPEGDPLPGLHIRRRDGGVWMAMPEEQAIDLATQIADLLESERSNRRKRGSDAPRANAR